MGIGSSQSQQKLGTGMTNMFGQSAPSSGMFGQSQPQSSSWFGGRKRKSKGKKKNNCKTKRRR